MVKILEAFNKLGYDNKQAESIIELMQLLGAIQDVDHPKNVLQQEFLQENNVLNKLKYNNLSEQINSINDILQANFARKTVERQENIDSSIMQETREIALTHFEILNLINEISPKYSHYNHALVFGGSEKSFEARVSYLKDLLNNIKIDNIDLLGATRKLWPKIDNMPGEDVSLKLVHKELINFNANVTIDDVANKFNQIAQDGVNKGESLTQIRESIYTDSFFANITWPTEYDLAHELANKYFDSEIYNVKIYNATSNDKAKRPTSVDNIRGWYFENKDQNIDKILAISTQPFIGYQSNIIRNIFDKNLFEKTDFSAPQLDKTNIKLCNLYDALASEIYYAKDRIIEENNKLVGEEGGFSTHNDEL